MIRYLLLVLLPLYKAHGASGGREAFDGNLEGDAAVSGTDMELRISGGRFLNHRKYPWLVTLGWLQGNMWQPVCGASIITPRHVLTATHCFIDPPKHRAPPVQQIAVLVGGYNIYQPPSRDYMKGVQQVFTHESYQQYVNDVAIIVLLEELVYNDGIQPICLPSPNVDVTGQRVIIAGNGAEIDHQGMTHQPKEMITDVVPVNTCVQSYGNHRPMLPEGQLCTWSQGESACQGDSGGPVMWLNPQTNKYVQVGLVSFGDSCVYRNKPVVHTRVSAYTRWIQSKLSGYQFCLGA